jgi:diguanylate cyclase (GGDEF)-like protein
MTAQGVGNRIRERIEHFKFRIGETDVQQTVSLGIASFPSHATDLASLIQCANEALESAKREGGNRVAIPHGINTNLQ